VAVEGWVRRRRGTGRTGGVPVAMSLEAYDLLAAEREMIPRSVERHVYFNPDERESCH
jgi:hypothetical protein